MQGIDEHLEAPRLGDHLVRHNVAVVVGGHQLGIASKTLQHAQMIAQFQDGLPFPGTISVGQLGVETPQRESFRHGDSWFGALKHGARLLA